MRESLWARGDARVRGESDLLSWLLRPLRRLVFVAHHVHQQCDICEYATLSEIDLVLILFVMARYICQMYTGISLKQVENGKCVNFLIWSKDFNKLNMSNYTRIILHDPYSPNTNLSVNLNVSTHSLTTQSLTRYPTGSYIIATNVLVM